MKTPERVGFAQLKTDFPGFGSYGKLHYEIPLAFGEPQLIESAILMEMVHSVNPKNILEIGRCKGTTTLNMALAAPDAWITTLDLPVPEGIYAESNSKTANDLWEKFGVKDRITEVLVDSKAFRPKETYSFIWLDGGHDAITVISDLEMAINCLNDKGVLCVHDYNKRSFPGVTAAVASFTENFNFKWVENRNDYLESSLVYYIKE